MMFENKLSAGEGFEQLKRYADHLHTYEHKGSKSYLIYTTQYEDRQDVSEIIDKSSDTHFIPLRWYQIYQWLIEFQEDTYIRKLIEFMEEIQLNESRKFLP